MNTNFIQIDQPNRQTPLFNVEKGNQQLGLIVYDPHRHSFVFVPRDVPDGPMLASSDLIEIAEEMRRQDYKWAAQRIDEREAQRISQQFLSHGL